MRDSRSSDDFQKQQKIKPPKIFDEFGSTLGVYPNLTRYKNAKNVKMNER